MAKTKKKNTTPKDINWGVIIRRSFWITIAGGVLVLAWLIYLAQDIPSLEQLENFDPDLVTRVYSQDGKVLDEFYLQKRVFVGLDQIPKVMQNALVASEDRRFRDHWGISLRSVARAVTINLLTLHYSQGFSTLSQQLARNLFKSIGFEETVTRKIKEVITAIQIERTYTKDEILEMYLNTVHFGHGTYGVQAAAKVFFDKDARDLTLDEAATLVGVLPSPVHYSPINYPNKATTRRNTVLRLMDAQGYITDAQYKRARALPLNVVEEKHTGKAPYFTEYIRRFMETEDERLGVNIYRDGLKIYTTLDSRLQDIAEEMVMRSVKENQDIFNKTVWADSEKFADLAYLGIFPEDTVKMMMEGEMPLYQELRDKLLVQCSFVAMDPHTGQILAMIGGRPDYHDQYNRAVQAARQPGSVFKPFVYTVAIDNGYPVTTQLMNQPVVLNVQNSDGEWVKWSPQNYDYSTGGLTTLRDGLRRSLNLIAVRLVQQLVPAREVKSLAQRMGISTNIRAVDAIALGTSEVYLMDVVAAYAILDNAGVYSKPFGITKVEDRYGNVIARYVPEQEEVLSEETAYLMTNMMQSVVDAGTGGSARWKYLFYYPAAGKTGTTQGRSDAWFVGYTPYIVAGVWFGIDSYPISLGPGREGSTAALPAWARFMRESHKTLDLPKKDFTRPPGVIEVQICSVSKKLPTSACPVETEVFKKGTEPTETCDVHKPY